MTLPSHLILLTDRPDAAHPASGRLPHLAGRARRVVVPAVVARPRWLVSGDAGDAAGDETSPPAPRQWAQRRLAFFAGHASMVSVLAHDIDESELVALSRIEQLLQDQADQVQVLGVLEERLHRRIVPCAGARARANFGHSVPHWV